MRTRSYKSAKRQAGLSLVDVMVGMVLGLIGTVIIFQVFEVSERVKRSTTGGGDAQQNGVAALFALERGVRQAGYGIGQADTAPVPIAILGAVANAPDSLMISYRPSNAADCPLSTPNCVWEYGPFAANNNLVFALPPPLTTLYYCVNAKAQLVTRTLPCANAGADPDEVILVEGIAQLKALPVMDGAGNMAAIQLAVVARNSQPEKLTDNSAPCDNVTAAANPTLTVTRNSPAWMSATVDLSGGLGLNAASDDWRCYRYKLFNATVPLRNVIWRP